MSQYLADYGWLAWIIIGLLAGAIAKADHARAGIRADAW